LHVSSGVFRLKCRSNRPSETDQLSKWSSVDRIKTIASLCQCEELQKVQ
jgi:hypothetical protein